MSTKQLVTGQFQTAIRRELRKLMAAGRLQARRTYYDYYDSCHAPIETPDAKWTMIVGSDPQWSRDFKAGGPSIYLVAPGHYELSTGYSTYEVRIVKAGA